MPLILILIAFVLVVLKACGPLALIPLWVCLLPLAPLVLALFLALVAVVVGLVIALHAAVKSA